MTLDQPWKIASLIALLAVLRLVWSVWPSAPARRFMVELLDSGLIAFILVFVVVRPFVVQAFFIPSESMVPTLLKGDRILVNKFIYDLNPPKRGDVIVFDAPPQALRGEEGKDFIKRLIGLPGDRILIRRGQGVFVNGKLFPEAPGTDIPAYDWPLDEEGQPTENPYVVPAGTYFVLGDNRNESFDSHLWFDPDAPLGPPPDRIPLFPIGRDGRPRIDRSRPGPRPELESWRVLGKALVIFWPPPRIGLIRTAPAPPLSGTAAAAAGRARE